MSKLSGKIAYIAGGAGNVGEYVTRIKFSYVSTNSIYRSCNTVTQMTDNLI